MSNQRQYLRQTRHMARGSAEILHQRQESIISRIETLESTLFSHHRSNGNDVPADDSHGRDLAPAIADALQSINVHSFKLHRVPQHYYDVSLEERKQMLGAPSTYHLTKSVVMTNTKHPPGSQNSSRELGKSPYVMVLLAPLFHFSIDTIIAVHWADYSYIIADAASRL